MVEPLVLTVEEAASLLRIGRTAAYGAARRGDLPTVRIGRALRVPRCQLDAMLGITQYERPEVASPGARNASTSARQEGDRVSPD